MDGFVSAYSTITGKKQRVPAHFIGHPVLGRNLELAPAAVAAAQNAVVEEVGPPSESWKREELDAHALTLGLDTSDLPNKGEVLAAIETAVAEAAAAQDSGDSSSSDQNPGDGEEEE